ncbi:esterase/lipase-like protein [Fibrella aestuarina BUZ 2]|uniref:Esterase/lipase-like protein n=1 Tax=Fibrella aestuarina BUZ 2 TaxID=1166018 RepID=I0KEI8_9BACT|nr:esterase/lipase-like protein [Fibrella aestuarina BUZ 2]
MHFLTRTPECQGGRNGPLPTWHWPECVCRHDGNKQPTKPRRMDQNTYLTDTPARYRLNVLTLLTPSASYWLVMLATLTLIGCGTGKTAIGRYNQQKINDVAYGSHPRNVMDVYLPANRTAQTPFAILIHGGAWVKAGKEYVRDIQDTLLNHGIAVASINHRYADTTAIHYPQMVADVDQAMAYCRKHAAEWHTRPDGFVLIGASSGGHLALLTA